MYKIAGKTALYKEQMKDRISRGANHLEIHLNERDVWSNDILQETINTALSISSLIEVIHVPIGINYSIEGINTDLGRYIIRNCFEIAQAVGNKENKNIPVVIHMESNYNQIKSWGLLDPIAYRLEELMKEYPNIEIALENVMMISNHSIEGLRHFMPKGGFGLDPVKLCEYINSPKVGLTLDTCHAMSSIRCIENIFPEKDKEIYRIEGRLINYFDNYKDDLKVIHLSNTIGNGHGNDKHGVGFETKKDLKLLKNILNKINEINYKGILTLEVGETDINKAETFSKLYNTINEIRGD